MEMSESKCRITNYDYSFNATEFNRLACSKCYQFLEFVFLDFEKLFTITRNGYLKYLYDDYNNETSLIDPSLSENQHFLREHMSLIEFNKWNSCCFDAKQCCKNVMSNLVYFKNECQSVWDGWSCHLSTKIGELSRVSAIIRLYLYKYELVILFYYKLKVKCPTHMIADECYSKHG